ncbi:MAG: glutamine--fructose-6-phosphate transaminase (isomerizing) [Lentisphaeria bacterium]
MCGIVGYIGGRDAVDILLNGLKRMEYRGYDSAGLATLRAGKLEQVKNTGKVQALADRVQREWPESFRQGMRIGIAHTRWATHGAPSDANAHPHLDAQSKIALVHNGIIENYAGLRKMLEAKGHIFRSETDSEVLAQLIGALYQGDLLQAVTGALRQVEGTFGIAVLAEAHPDMLVAARRGSPLLIGLGDGESIIASDAAAVVSHTRNVIYLDDDDIAVVGHGTADIRNINNVPVSRAVSHLDWDSGAAEKGGYEHFMLKEIFEQPDALRNCLRGRLDDTLQTAVLTGLGLEPRDMAAIERMVLVACGTSLHAAMVGKYFIEELAGIPVETEQAAEFRYRNPILGPHDLVLAISQSGETADTLAAVREAKHKGALVAGMCNVVASTIARETGCGIYLHAGPEIGVASTKAFTCQVAALLLLALKLGRGRRLSRQQGVGLVAAIKALPELVAATLKLNDSIARVAAVLAGCRDCFYIGRGVLHPVALEGALKLKEISYVHAEGYHAAELKHGPIALLEEAVPVVALAADLPGKDKMVGNIQECRARGAPVIAVVSEGDEAILAALRPVTQWVIELPAAPSWAVPVVCVVALQLLAYHAARLRGCPIDQPRNLAKSVTVE